MWMRFQINTKSSSLRENEIKLILKGSKGLLHRMYRAGITAVLLLLRKEGKLVEDRKPQGPIHTF